MRRIVLRDRTEVEVTEEAMRACPEVAALRDKYAQYRAKAEAHYGGASYIEDPQVCSFCLARTVKVNHYTCGWEDCLAAAKAFLAWADENLRSLRR